MSQPFCAGFKHVHRPRIPPRVEIEHDADVLGPGILVRKDAGSKQTGFLAIAQDHDHVALDGAAGPERAETFQDGRHARRVVPRPGPGLDRVVMGREQERFLPGGPEPRRCATTLPTSARDRAGGGPGAGGCSTAGASRGSSIAGSSPSAPSSAMRYVRTFAAAGEPRGCGSCAIASTCRMALSAEKTSAGESAGSARGGIRDQSASPHTAATKAALADAASMGGQPVLSPLSGITANPFRDAAATRRRLKIDPNTIPLVK